ncbi:MAG: hypothetical protein IIY00_05615 [Clostridia bacterium]|nr:hypothetical protein [Clostridia bacterium]
MAPAAIAALLIMAAALLLSMIDFSFLNREEENHIVLPGRDGQDVTVETETYAENLAMLQAVTVDRTNIKKLIGAMQRPESYHLVVGTTLYHSGGQTTTGADGYVSGGRYKSVVYDAVGGGARHCLIYGEDAYIWSQSSPGVFAGKAGSFTGDNSLWIPTYELLLELEDDAVLSADYALYGDEYCLAVETLDPLSGNRILYYISVEHGLLVGAQSFEGETLVYALTAEVLPLIEDPNTIFRLPDGTVIGE